MSDDERQARADHGRFEALFRTTGDLVGILDRDGAIVAVNRSVPGVPAEHLVGRPAEGFIGLDDLPRWREAWERARRHQASETIAVRGRITHSRYELTVVPLAGTDELLVVGRDVHDRDLAEALRQRFTERVLEAQEEERHRVGRELHDVTGGELAGLALQIEQLALAVPEVAERVRELAASLRMVTEQLARTARGLHLGPLEELGMAPVLARIIADLAATSTLAVEVRLELLRSLPPPSNAVATAICRVVQQALTNTIQHAEARRATVEIATESEAHAVEVADDGKGFDLGLARRGGGLGLLVMHERMRLVGGALAIFTEPGRGTRVRLVIPHSAWREPT